MFLRSTGDDVITCDPLHVYIMCVDICNVDRQETYFPIRNYIKQRGRHEFRKPRLHREMQSN
jgi:hypothetical protein